jgi:hypothetical protein
MTKPQRESHEEATKRLLVDQNSWPLWPVLPLKRPSKKDKYGLPEIAFVLADNYLKVVCCSMYDIQENKDKYYAAQRIQYDSVDKLLLDGWRVD